MQHALLIPQDHLRCLDVHQALETIVADDHAAIEVVQVGRSKPAPFKRNKRAKVRRDDRDDVEDHPFRTVRLFTFGGAEGIEDAQTLEVVGALLLREWLTQHLALKEIIFVGINATQQFLDGFTADEGDELARIFIVHVAFFRTQAGEHFEILIFCQQVLRLEAGGTRLDHDVGFVIDDPFDVLGRHADHTGDLARERAKEPDVDDRYGQHDVTHTFAAHALLRDLDAAAVADNAFVADTLVLTAGAFPVTDRAEDLLAEQTVFFRTE